MDTILILSRGRRLSRIFSETARQLSQKFRIVAVLGSWSEETAADELPDWQGIPNLETIDLLAEIRARTNGPLAERATQIEREIGLTVYQSASTYLLYRRFAKQYFGLWRPFYDTEQEILAEFVSAYDLFDEIMRVHRPVVAFCETPDLSAHRVAQAVARKHGVFQLGNAFNNIFGDGIAWFTYGSNRRSPLLEHYYRNREEISDASWQAADELISRVGSGSIHNAHYVEFHKRAISQRPAFHTRVLRNIKKVTHAATYRTLGVRLRHERNRRWLNENMQRDMPTGRYVLVSLHYQPEASTAMVAPRWIDQDKVIEQLSIAAPVGVRIVVKENPKGFGFRGEDYYGKLKELPNVILVHPTVSNDDLLRNAEVIFPIAGTTGMEGIVLGKKVALIGRPAYDIYAGLRRLDWPEDVFKYMADSTWRPEEMRDERRHFLAAIAETGFFLGKPLPSTPWPEPEEAGRNYAKALERFVAMCRRTGMKPTDVDITL